DISAGTENALLLVAAEVALEQPGRTKRAGVTRVVVVAADLRLANRGAGIRVGIAKPPGALGRIAEHGHHKIVIRSGCKRQLAGVNVRLRFVRVSDVSHYARGIDVAANECRTTGGINCGEEPETVLRNRPTDRGA